MKSRIIPFSLLGLAIASPLQQQEIPQQQQQQSFLYHDANGGPSIENALRHANQLFNALHSSMRQWGSSVQHNGMSFFPATVPAGTLFYHGTPDPHHVKGFEWLAFEIPHAELFAHGIANRPKQPERDREDGPEPHIRDWPVDDLLAWASAERSTGESGGGGPIEPGKGRGYLQIYQAQRELKVLYLDGMAAAKCTFGPLDTQDLVLTHKRDNDNIMRSERERARDMCAMSKEWGIDGIMRMETGFEIIFCDFEEGLDLLSARERPGNASSEELGQWSVFEYVRDAGQRYQTDVGGGRVEIRYENMVSAYFYDANFSNPNTESRDPRLVNTDDDLLGRIKEDVRQSLVAAFESNAQPAEKDINWRDVVDMIGTRYSDRLNYLATYELSETQFLSILNMLLNLFVDYPRRDTALEISRCANHYLQPVVPRTESDFLLYAAVSHTNGRICSALFEAQELLLNSSSVDFANDSSSSVQRAKDVIIKLNNWLDWPEWKFCSNCRLDQVCFIAMFPFGSQEDHDSPRCKTEEDLKFEGWGDYWREGRTTVHESPGNRELRVDGVRGDGEL